MWMSEERREELRVQQLWERRRLQPRFDWPRAPNKRYGGDGDASRAENDRSPLAQSEADDGSRDRCGAAG